MSIPLLLSGFLFLFKIPSEVQLSVISSVLGCLWPISSYATQSGNVSRVFMKSAAISASDTDDTTFLMIFAKIRIDPFICCLSLLPR